MPYRKTDDDVQEVARVSWKSIKFQLFGMPGVFIAVMIVCSIPGAIATYVMWRQTYFTAETASFLGDKFDDMTDTVKYEHDMIKFERMKDQCVALYDFKERKAIRETLTRDGLQAWCTWLPPAPVAPIARRPRQRHYSGTPDYFMFSNEAIADEKRSLSTTPEQRP